MIDHVDEKKNMSIVQEDTLGNVLQQHEKTEAVSVWEISRRRFWHSRHTAAQACTQGKRRQLRRFLGRNR